MYLRDFFCRTGIVIFVPCSCLNGPFYRIRFARFSIIFQKFRILIYIRFRKGRAVSRPFYIQAQKRSFSENITKGKQKDPS